ncbi:unnamed protein product, partial [Symbiodinium necroappetens]
SAEAFGALRPSSPRDLTTACYLLGIADGGPGSAWRAVHSALADAVLTAKVVMAINAILQEAPPSEFTALPPLPCRLQRVSEAAADVFSLSVLVKCEHGRLQTRFGLQIPAICKN